MSTKKTVIALLIILLVFFLVTLFSGCKKQAGTIIFTANGEDFVRQGFIDKTGWEISFDNVFVNIADPTAYMPEADGAEAVLKGNYWIDLAAGDENADPITIGKVEDVKAGNYQSLKFKLRTGKEGTYAGFSIVMTGTASKKGDTKRFFIKLNEEILFDGKEGYVGDNIKGILKAGGSTSVEMTFHFDHIFGDIEAPADDHINTGSVGFEFFNEYAKAGMVDITQDELKSAGEYSILIKSIETLGHLGEGHCEAHSIND